jgi:hypothetical protein
MCKCVRVCKRVGLAKTIYVRCIYGIFGRETTKDTVVYIAYTPFWPTLYTGCVCLSKRCNLGNKD